jgi:indole-3-glycerol phosphate synthase
MSQTPDILKTIIRHKAEEVAQRAQVLSLKALSARVEAAPAVRPFQEALRERTAAGHSAVIAEIKKASPSRGVLREAFDPPAIAEAYARAGASCLSVLTDARFFQGDDAHLREARAVSGLPVLRKDFVIDPYQVYEARVMGADCILLIVAALGDASLAELHMLACELGMDVLVEVHDGAELERALALGADMIGINNRDLRSFETRLETTLDLVVRIPAERLVVSESGIHSRADVALVRGHGVHTFLVGEAFMKAADPGLRLRELFG